MECYSCTRFDCKFFKFMDLYRQNRGPSGDPGLLQSETPGISIVIPSMNRRGTLKSTLDSLCALNYDRNRLEVIVVDGDGTGEVNRILTQYPFKVVTDDGTGLNRARNIGFVNATHELVAFTDDDCLVPPDWATKIVDSFSLPEVGFVGGKVLGFSEEELLSRYIDETIIPATATFAERTITREVELFKFPAGCNMAFRRDALRSIDLLDERINYGFDDLEALERIVAAGYVLVLNPDVKVVHNHRSRMKDFLKQNFRYGRGAMLFLLTKRKESMLYRWISNFLLAVCIGVMIVFLPPIAAFVLNMPFLTLFSPVLLAAPWVALIGFYKKRSARTLNLKKLLLYPLIDILRGFSFVLGSALQLLMHSFSAKR